MTDIRTDHDLVAAHLRGDRTALAGIYDRYADSLYDTAAAMLSDRHEAADVMQDIFVVAAERLDQLRQPERLRAWLFAILRNEVYRRTKRRSRTRPTDFSAPGVVEMSTSPKPNTETNTELDQLAEQELAELIRSAATGLDPRDQLVLELSVRHGLAGADLAEALGVTAEQSHVMVHRMRDRVERSLGALTVARMGRKDCRDLARLLIDWDGTFSVLIRKRVARHIDGCELCDSTKRRYAVIALMGAAPVFAAPAGLRELVLQGTGAVPPSEGPGSAPDGTSRRYRFDDTHGFPTLARISRRALAMAAAMALLIVGGGIGLGAALIGDDVGEIVTPSSTAFDQAADHPEAITAEVTTTEVTTTEVSTTEAPTVSTVPTTVAPSVPPTEVPDLTVAPTAPVATPPPPTVAPPPGPAPGQLVASSNVVDLGSTSRTAQVVLTNAGGSSIDWRLDGSAAPFILSTTGGSLSPGHAVEVQLGIDRSAAAEGPVETLFALVSSGDGDGQFVARATVERAPVVTVVRSSRSIACPWTVDPLVAATVVDESALTSVNLSWSGPGSTRSTAMISPEPGGWRAQLALPRINGTWRWVITATDARGNAGTASGAIVVSGC